VTEQSDIKLSNYQVDHLGDRLRAGQPSADDLRLLDRYRRSFAESYEYVISAIRNQLKLDPTGRPTKSTASIVGKLRRESTRLSQMQDIAGCRIVLPDVVTQDSVVQGLVSHLGKVKVFDRRYSPSHGYRAVHIVVSHSQKNVEIQIRSVLQHMWAELSEKLADVIDPAVKYGRGPEWLRIALMEVSKGITEWERLETQLCEINPDARNLPTLPRDFDRSNQRTSAAKSEAGRVLAERLIELMVKLSNHTGS
jgi:ppGpp synthetase/RelA/SpoT-type nucleotidyltranferase